MKSTVEHWTDGRYRAFVVSALRAAFRKFPNKFAALKNAQVGKKINKLTKREAMHYKCAACKKAFPATAIDVDHVSPVVDGEFVDWDTYIQRLYCSVENLQVLCRPCHKKKTAEERSKKCSTQPKVVKPATKKRTTGVSSQRSKNSSTKSVRSK